MWSTTQQLPANETALACGKSTRHDSYFNLLKSQAPLKLADPVRTQLWLCKASPFKVIAFQPVGFKMPTQMA